MKWTPSLFTEFSFHKLCPLMVLIISLRKWALAVLMIMGLENGGYVLWQELNSDVTQCWLCFSHHGLYSCPQATPDPICDLRNLGDPSTTSQRDSKSSMHKHWLRHGQAVCTHFWSSRGPDFCHWQKVPNQPMETFKWSSPRLTANSSAFSLTMGPLKGHYMAGHYQSTCRGRLQPQALSPCIFVFCLHH